MAHVQMKHVNWKNDIQFFNANTITYNHNKKISKYIYRMIEARRISSRLADSNQSHLNLTGFVVTEIDL
jgi:hypothetical protein